MENFADVKATGGEDPTKTKQVFKPMSLQKALFGGGIKNQEVARHVEERIIKDLRSSDLAPLRITSFDDQVESFRCEETMFLQMCEKNGVEQITDFQVQWLEDRIGSDVAENVNLNSDTFASESGSNWGVRTNTLGFQGTKVKIRMIAQQLGLQSGLKSVDATARELRDAFIRVRRLQESLLLVNEEVTTEGLNFAPTFRGFITDATLYTNSVSGDLTNAAIQGRVDAIANEGSTEQIGYGNMLVAFCPANQLPKIRDLMSSRYPGETSIQNALAYQSALKSMFGEAGAYPNQVQAYQPLPGAPVLFVHNPLMPASTVLYFMPSEPRLYRFAIDGKFGPWAIDKSESLMGGGLGTVVYCLDGISLRTGAREKKAVQTLT